MNQERSSGANGVPTEIFVTGAGVVSGFGQGLPALVEGLARGESAARPPRVHSLGSLPVQHLAEVPGSLPRVPGFEQDRRAGLLALASREARRESGLSQHPQPDSRCGVFVGTGLSSVTPLELEEDLYPALRGERFDRAELAAALRPRGGAPARHCAEQLTSWLARRWGAGGPVQTSFGACAASAHAVVDAVRALRRGEIHRAVVAGHDSMTHPLGVLSFVLLGTLCEQALCRPFDVRRSGFLLGEGAAVLVLERPEVAEARSAPLLGRILGVGTSVDAHAVTAPHPEGRGAWLAMARALDDAGLEPGAVDLVNAHGTGTQVGDLAEALAVERLLGTGVPVTSIKGATGHTIAAAGVVELAATLGAFTRGFTPGTAGCEQPDPACPVDVVTSPRPEEPRTVMSNSFGFGGQNGSLVVAHPHA